MKHERHVMIVTMNFDVVIVGGGLVGASLAAALKHSGLSLALVENHAVPALGGEPATIWDSRIYAISPGSRSFLERCGAWPLLDSSRFEPVEAMRVFGDTGAELEFSAYQMGVAELACIVENRALQYALWQVLQDQEDLTLFNPARCSSLSFAADAAELVLEDGRVLRTKLVVGADGGDSWVRTQAGINAVPVDYHQYGVVANFAIGRAHRAIAHQWFQSDGILALLPLPGDRVSMVWSVSAEHSTRLLAMANDALSEQVAAASQHMLGKLELITAANAFPLRLLKLPQTTAPRMALIGDAAHCLHPLAGQGVNTGFRDARQLAKLLLERGPQIDSGDARLLRSYERKRREDVYTMQLATDGLKKLFNNDDPILRSLRNGGLSATNRIAPLKKLFMQHALH